MSACRTSVQSQETQFTFKLSTGGCSHSCAGPELTPMQFRPLSRITMATHNPNSIPHHGRMVVSFNHAKLQLHPMQKRKASTMLTYQQTTRLHPKLSPVMRHQADTVTQHCVADNKSTSIKALPQLYPASFRHCYATKGPHVQAHASLQQQSISWNHSPATQVRFVFTLQGLCSHHGSSKQAAKYTSHCY